MATFVSAGHTRERPRMHRPLATIQDPRPRTLCIISRHSEWVACPSGQVKAQLHNAIRTHRAQQP
uniref:MIP22367p n=1 Tax=Drosophila melanogaster TaxID=7227 RepID=F0JAQ7_DROME|nr:MIP22367p [Drosophila melanogaster]